MFIPLLDAPTYLTGEFRAALDVFYTTETMGCLPFSGGWAEQPLWITSALSVLKVEKWRADEEERESKRREEEDTRKYGSR